MSQHGLVIGKFYPPHAGHQLLIEQAAARTRHLSVLVMAATGDTITLASRVGWLRSIYAGRNIDILGVHCDIATDLGSQAAWEANVALMRAAVRTKAAPSAGEVDTLFTSEGYGPELATRLQVRHASIDPARTTVPMSATRVRAGLPQTWTHLHPIVRRDLSVRVIVLGSESTGTTTVSAELADRLNRDGDLGPVAWVPEYGREYAAGKVAAAGAVDLVWWEAADFTAIARTQRDLEDAAAQLGPMVVCDTDALATSVWQHRYLRANLPLCEFPDALPTDLPGRRLYLLTDHVGVPFVQDGTRDGEQVRAPMTRWFEDALTVAETTWVKLTGGHEDRIEMAARTVRDFYTACTTFTDPLEVPALSRQPVPAP